MQHCWDHDPYLRPEVSKVLRVLSPPSVFRSFWLSCACLLKYFPTYSEDPAWKRLTSLPFTTPERISLITQIFSDDDEVLVVEKLHGDDAQNFIDVIYEVNTCTF